mmetsp:Transcript_35908/g.49836  ORF Transcript_35908/g.49836 Transcript_35908/m.49836 type:complete len:207 (+) Transcript_35908:173-793(+)
MDWSKTRIKHHSEFKMTKMKGELAGYGPKMVDSDYKKTIPWVDKSKQKVESNRFLSDMNCAYGPRVVNIQRPDITHKQSVDSCNDWVGRLNDSKSTPAIGAASEHLFSWRDKLARPNDKLPPVKFLKPHHWRTQYTKDFSEGDKTLHTKTRLFPEEGTLDKVTSRQNFSLAGNVKPFMHNALERDPKVNKFNEFGATKVRSQIVFG